MSTSPNILARRPVVVPARERTPHQQMLEQASWLAQLMDSKFEIPGLRIRFGFDALLGLFPGIGDTLSALASLYILQGAWEARVPRVTLVRMTLNIMLDAILGAVPIVGDLFDLAWKANVKNVELLRKHVSAAPQQSREARRADVVVVGVAFVLIVGAAAFTATASVLIARAVFHAIF